jgi:hypothetical protein
METISLVITAAAGVEHRLTGMTQYVRPYAIHLKGTRLTSFFSRNEARFR